MWRRNQKKMTKRDCKSTVGLEQGSSGIEAFKDSSNCHLKLRRTGLLLIMMVMMIVGDDYYFSYFLSKIRNLQISVFFFYFLTFEKADCTIFALSLSSVGWSIDVAINFCQYTQA